ncbi:MAG: YitT family protein [Allorhizobium sp.]
MAQVSNVLGIWNANPARHSAAEDIQGILSGSMVSALGLYLLAKVGLLTGGMAGVAFLLHYASDVSFGLIFFLLNLPFYILSLRRVGLDFTLKTFAAIGLTSLVVELEDRFIRIDAINPAWGAILGGLLLGYGILALFRHRASLGGIGILSVYLQDRFGWRAGLVQLAFDLTVMLFAFAVVSPTIVVYSVLGAVVLNLFVAINHRSDRYIAVR